MLGCRARPGVWIITKLIGEIIYYSPAQAGAHDQKQWNLLNLRSLFLEKTYGIIGDGGFTFNTKTKPEWINGEKPFKKPRKGTLTVHQKNWNRRLLEMRVIVKNTIQVLKVFKIVGSVFLPLEEWPQTNQHWHGSSHLCCNGKLKRI